MLLREWLGLRAKEILATINPGLVFYLGSQKAVAAVCREDKRKKKRGKEVKGDPKPSALPRRPLFLPFYP